MTGFLGGRLALVSALLCLGAASAQAEPFYGYSGYYGGPAVYYTPTPDVHQTTRMEDGSQHFGIRTYTAGGPFWRYKLHPRPLRPASYHPVRRVIRVRG